MKSHSVKVTSGPFKGRHGKLVGYKTGRAVVEVGKERVALYVDQLESVEQIDSATQDPCGEPHAR